MRPAMLLACLFAAGCGRVPLTQPQATAASMPPVRTAPVQATALGHPDDPVIARFAGKLASSDAFERMHGAMGLAMFGEQAKSAAPVLCRVLLKADDDERPVVANALSTVSPDLHGPVTVMAEGKDTLAINKAEQDLLKLGPKARDAWPVVVENLRRLTLLRDKPPLDTKAADQDKRMVPCIRILEVSGAAEEVPAYGMLLTLTANRDAGTCEASMKAASAALGVLGEKRTDLRSLIVPALLVALPPLAKAGSTEPIVALGKLGPDARETLPELEKLKNAENETVRKAAAEAIEKIAK